MEICPKCQSIVIRKDGIVKEKQRFRCKICDYRFTVPHIGKPVNKKREALLMYLSGYNYRTIGEVISVSHVSVFKWIKEFGEPLTAIKMDKQRPVTFNDIEQFQKDNKNIRAIILIGFTDEITEIMLAKK